METRLSQALFIQRLSIASFLAVWASLKFYRPEWMVNVFKNVYGLDWVTKDYAYAVGTFQALVVLIFAIGLYRTFTYAFVTLMHGTGIIGAALNGSLWKFTSYPQNLLWTSVATLGALIALFLLRHHDGFTVDGFRDKQKAQK